MNDETRKGDMMRRFSQVLGIAVVLAVLAALHGLKSSAGASTGPATIRITDRQFGYTRVDVGARGRSPGDNEIIFDRLYNRTITRKPIGSARFICTFTNGITRTCIATISLPKGELVATGTVRFRQFYDIAVVGGTGLYDNARGTLTVIRTTRNPTREILYFRLAG
jgi:hypothetical protein